MGKKDIVAKRYMRDKVRFADLFNGSLFQGEQIIKPENLIEGNAESDLYLKDINGKKRAIARYHDILMKTDFAIFTEEGQADIHYAMPVRGMSYDSLLYTDQVREIRKEHERKGEKISGAEFLSGMKKEDKLKPVVSIVVYYGDKEWDASKDLHGMLDFGESKEVEQILRKIVPNYGINLIDASRIENTKIYESDLQTIFEMLKYKQDKKSLKRYMNNNKEELSQMDDDAWDMLGVMLHEEKWFDKYRETEGGKQDMCKAFDDWEEEIREEAFKEANSNWMQGVKSLKDVLSPEVIAEKMNLPVEVVVNL